MLPPILEIFIVWHPDDSKGSDIAKAIFNHFMRGQTFSGVIGGGVQVSLRSAGWTGRDSAPRQIYSEANSGPNGIRPANFVAVVPLLGNGMAMSVENTSSEWYTFVNTIVKQQKTSSNIIGVFPFLLSQSAANGTKLGRIMGHYQFIAASMQYTNEDGLSMLCRDLTQGLAQFISTDNISRLTVFISHTRHYGHQEGEDVDKLITLVRKVIRNTHLEEFFDASSLQPGTDWANELRQRSSTSALLAIRTDLYSSREWCQREVSNAKCAGMPIVMIDAIVSGEERGSFLMDHVPRIAMRKSNGEWQQSDVYRTLNLLVDECLKRVLWLHQKELAQERPELQVAWWAPHAPEPLTLSNWIEKYLQEPDPDNANKELRILHPDPPLSPKEREVLRKYVKTTRLGCNIDIMTPRQLAARGG